MGSWRYLGCSSLGCYVLGKVSDEADASSSCTASVGVSESCLCAASGCVDETEYVGMWVVDAVSGCSSAVGA